MSISEVFINVLKKEINTKKPKESSLIKEWLCKDVSQSTCIRIGNYFESFFAEMMGKFNWLPLLTPSGKTYTITVDGEIHQVDLMGCVEEGIIITREVKCNLDLDRGKTRDTVRKEEQIQRGIKDQFGLNVDGGVFCPFFYGYSKKHSKFGEVYGLQWFIDTFNCSFTVEDFKQMGKNKEVQELLV